MAYQQHDAVSITLTEAVTEYAAVRADLAGGGALYDDPDVGANQVLLGFAQTKGAIGDTIKVQAGRFVRARAGAALDPANAADHLLMVESGGTGELVRWTAGHRLAAIWYPESSAAVENEQPITVMMVPGGIQQGDYTATATVPTGSDTPAAALAVGANYDGNHVTISVNQAAPDDTATSFSYTWDGSGNLTITANANATADTDLVVRVAG